MKLSVKILIGAAVLLLIITAALSFYIVEEDEHALVLRFSKVEHIVSEAGLHFKIPFIDTIKTYPQNVQLYDLQPSDVLTSDSKAMSVDSYVVWQISDPLTFYRTLGTTLEAQSRLDAAIYNALINIIGTMKQDEIITETVEGGRNDLNIKVYEKVKEYTATYGIEITDVKIKRFDLPAENESAVYERMIAERNQITQKYIAEGKAEATKIRNRADLDVNVLISDANVKAEMLVAEGESEYMRLLAEAYNTADKQEFFTFMRSLDALKASLTGESKTVILSADSELAKILMGSSNGE